MNNPIPPLLSNCLALFAIYYLLMPAPAYGYFDLGTGTYIIQMVLGFGAAVWLSLRTSWIRFDRKKKTGGLASPDAALNNSAHAPQGIEDRLTDGESK
ncbi:MAG: hypothetical protein KGS72_09115 [Cyanobacteria bacterium REEB67]|nr:hypothetical protein [Cyanobacteria bacterium REEB67]